MTGRGQRLTSEGRESETRDFSSPALLFFWCVVHPFLFPSRIVSCSVCTCGQSEVTVCGEEGTHTSDPAADFLPRRLAALCNLCDVEAPPPPPPLPRRGGEFEFVTAVRGHCEVGGCADAERVYLLCRSSFKEK